jgi:hypothetical protein
VNGVTVQDILSILTSIRTNKTFVEWTEAYEEAYLHFIDQNNPHEVTVDQLKTKVIQVIYETWLSEGYQGSLQNFIDLLFQYIEIADDAKMQEGTSEVAVPSVAVFQHAIDRHDEDLGAHEELINPMFPGNEKIVSPILVLSSLVGAPRDIASNLTSDSKKFAGILLDVGSKSDEFTVAIACDFVEESILVLKWADTDTVEVSFSPTTSQVNIRNGVTSFVITLDEIPTKLDIALSVYAGYLTVHVGDTFVNMGNIPLTASDALTCDVITFDALHSFVVYPEALTLDQIVHVFEILD